MRTKLSTSVLLILALAAVAPVYAQTTFVQPSVIQQETVANQQLKYQFYNVSNVLKGRIQYMGDNPVNQKYFGFTNVSADYLAFFTNPVNSFTIFYVSGAEVARFSSTGLRIGTNPAETAVKLTVNGAIDVKGNIAAKYQDVAEWVPSLGDPTPGTVVVLAEEAINTVEPSSTSYDTRVAGVVSHQPGVILGEPGEDKVQVATTGRVRVRVDATAGPIKIGDLLVTSDKPGVAMKSLPIEVAGIKMHRPGTVVGKALEPLAGGVGEILVLLSLQ